MADFQSRLLIKLAAVGLAHAAVGCPAWQTERREDTREERGEERGGTKEEGGRRGGERREEGGRKTWRRRRGAPQGQSGAAAGCPVGCNTQRKSQNPQGGKNLWGLRRSTLPTRTQAEGIKGRLSAETEKSGHLRGRE